MTPSDDAFDLSPGTTEQAPARFEAKCAWSDVGQLAEAFAPARTGPRDGGERGAS